MFSIILINLKKILTIYFTAHFSWHSQTLENIFQLIYHDTIKHKKIIHFLGIYFSRKLLSRKKKLLPTNKRDLVAIHFPFWIFEYKLKLLKCSWSKKITFSQRFFLCFFNFFCYLLCFVKGIMIFLSMNKQ